MMIDYHNPSSGDVLYVYESNAPAPSLPAAIRTPGAGGGLPLVGRIGATTSSAHGGHTARPLESVIVDGTR